MIRKANKKDAKRIGVIAESTGNFKENEIDACMDMVADSISEEYYLNFDCYEKKGIVLGFVCYGQDEMTEGTWEIYWIAVHKEFQGKSIGKKLMLHAEKQAKKHKGRQVVLETSSQINYRYVHKFYKRLGYKKKAVVKDYFSKGDHK